MIKEKISIQSDDGSLKNIDWVIFAVLGAFCFFTMQQGDILHTGGSSISLLNGHFIDFYEYTAEYLVGNNYMITTYILFALWNIPIRLLEIVRVPTMDVPYAVLMWYKALPTLVYILSGYLIFAICQELKLGINKSKIAAYAFMTMPIGFYSQFMFGQYDIFTVFFMLLGLIFYLRPQKRALYYCSLLFGVACTFKYFALLIYAPLILLREKKIGSLLRHALCFTAPVLLAVCPYLASGKFQKGVVGFRATSFVFNAGIDNGFHMTSIIPVLWIVVCIYALLKDESSSLDEIFTWAVFLCNIVLLLCFGLSMWHPQWLLVAVPFWSLSTVTRKRVDVSCILNIMLMLFFSMSVANSWPDSLDQQLFSLGIFRDLVAGRTGTALTMRDIYIIVDEDLIWTCFVGILAANTFMSHPKYCSEDLSCNIKATFGWLRARFLVGISIFLIPMLICLVSLLGLPKLSYAPSAESIGVIPPTSDTQILEQIFTPSTGTISRVDIQIGTYMRTNFFTLKVDIVDDATGEVLASMDVDASKLIDNAYEEIHFEPVKVEAGERYRIVIRSEGADDQNTVSIYRTADETATDRGHARLDGIDQAYDLSIKVYGD